MAFKTIETFLMKNILTKYDFGIADSFMPLRESQNENGIQYGVYILNNGSHDLLKTPIYRYMEFAHLIELIEKGILFVPNRQRFTDLREHSELQIKSLEEAMCVLENMPNYRSRAFLKQQQERYAQIWNQAVLCWTFDAHGKDKQNNELGENYLMWRCHANKHFVCRIRTTIEHFAKSLDDVDYDILVSPVDYEPLPIHHLANEPSRIFKKPAFYQDEQEVRCVVLHNDMRKCTAKEDIKLRINPSILIEEIKLSPFINKEEERLLETRLREVISDSSIKVRPSLLMEYKEGVI